MKNYKVMAIKYLILFSFVVIFSRANAQEITIWSASKSTLVISKDSVSIPTVRILDDVIIRYYTLTKKIDSTKIPSLESSFFDGVGSLKENEQAFLGVCDLYIIIFDDEFYIILDEKNSGRFGLARAVNRNSLIFQTSQLKMFPEKSIPANIVKILASQILTDK